MQVAGNASNQEGMPASGHQEWVSHSASLGVLSSHWTRREALLTCMRELHGAVRQLRLWDPHFTVSREATCVREGEERGQQNKWRR